MIERLLDVTPNARPRAARPARPKIEPAQPPERRETVMVTQDAISTARLAAAQPAVKSTTVADAPVPVCDLPPLVLDDREIELRPTLFIGIGGLAARTIQVLHERIVARFGDPAAFGACNS